MLGHRLLRHVDLGRDLTHGARAVAKQTQDLDTARLPEGLQRGRGLSFRSVHK